LIAARVDVNRPDAEIHTALHYAAMHGHFELTMMLIEHDADKSATTREGYTAIMLAAKHRHGELVEVLASYDIPDSQAANDSRSGTARATGMDYKACYEVAQALANKTQAHRMDALRHAVTHNDLPMAARLVATGNIALEEHDEHGHTLLVLAASRGDADMIRLLLCAGAGVDTVDNKGKTPLMHAAAKRHLPAIAALLHAGAIATRTDNDNESALSQAICNDDTVLLGALLAGKAGVLDVHSNVSLLEKAASLGNQGTVRMLLASGADVPDANGSLMLAVVARQGKLAAFNTLLLAGADPHHSAWDGQSRKITAGCDV
jgi:ankyrin repeat protein